jgi:hypothetical protein
MKELIRSNDPVRLSFALAVLRDAGLHPFLADRFMASAEGSISAVQQRLMVPEEEEQRARRVLDQAESDIERGPAASGDDRE